MKRDILGYQIVTYRGKMGVSLRTKEIHSEELVWCKGRAAEAGERR